MAVRLISTIQRFKGLSSDAKPVDVPEGSTFYETDSGRRYIYINYWIEDMSDDVSAGSFDKSQAEIRRTEEQQFIASGISAELEGAAFNLIEFR